MVDVVKARGRAALIALACVTGTLVTGAGEAASNESSDAVAYAPVSQQPDGDGIETAPVDCRATGAATFEFQQPLENAYLMVDLQLHHDMTFDGSFTNAIGGYRGGEYFLVGQYYGGLPRQTLQVPRASEGVHNATTVTLRLEARPTDTIAHCSAWVVADGYLEDPTAIQCLTHGTIDVTFPVARDDYRVPLELALHHDMILGWELLDSGGNLLASDYRLIGAYYGGLPRQTIPLPSMDRAAVSGATELHVRLEARGVETIQWCSIPGVSPPRDGDTPFGQCPQSTLVRLNAVHHEPVGITKPWKLIYDELLLHFDRQEKRPGSFCTLESTAGSLLVLADLPVLDPFPVGTSTSVATLDFLEDAPPGAEVCNFGDSHQNFCYLTSTPGPAEHTLRWKIPGFKIESILEEICAGYAFVRRCVSVGYPANRTTPPYTFYVTIEDLVGSNSRPPVDVIVQQAETYIHEELIDNLPAIDSLMVVQEPPAELSVEDSHGRSAGQTPTGPAATIPGSSYIAIDDYSAVLVINPEPGNYAAKVTGARGDPYALSFSMVDFTTTTGSPDVQLQHEVDGSLASLGEVTFAFVVGPGGSVSGPLNPGPSTAPPATASPTAPSATASPPTAPPAGNLPPPPDPVATPAAPASPEPTPAGPTTPPENAGEGLFLIEAERSTIRAGRRVVLHGEITGDASCVESVDEIVLVKSVGGTGTEREIGRVPLAPDRTWTYAHRAWVSGTYRAVTAPTAGCSVIDAASTTVQVRSTLRVTSITACPSRPRIVGRVSPKHSGTDVYLQRRRLHEWKAVDRDRVNRLSVFTLFAPSCTGEYRITWPKQSETNARGSLRLVI